MITLIAGDTLRGKATNATAVSFIASILEISTVETYKNVQAQLPSSTTTQYTVPGSTQALLREILFTETTGVDQVVSLFLNGTSLATRIAQFTVVANGMAILTADGVRTYDSTGKVLTNSIVTLTGDVTGSGSGTIATTIATNIVDNTKTAQMAQSTVKGRAAAAGTGNATDLTPTQVKTLLAIANTDVSGLGTLATISNLTGPVTSVGAATTITADAVDNTMLSNMVQATIKGRAAAAGTGDPTDLTAAQVKTLLAIANTDISGLGTLSTVSNLTGPVTSVGAATTVTADAIDNTMTSNMVQSTIKGRAAAAGTGDPTDLTAAQVKTLLAIANTDVSGLGTLSTISNLTGPVTSVGAATAVTAGAVTNTMLANMAQRTFKGRQITAGTGAPVDLTSVEATANLELVSTSIQGAMAAADKRKLNSIWKDAVEDGGCSNTGTTDSSPLITALLATFPAGFPGTIYFPAGIYRFDSAVTIATEGITILGQGRRTAKLCSASATANIFTVTGDAVLFENLRFSAISGGIDADTAGAPGIPARALRTAGYAVEFQAATDSSGMRKCDILFQWSGVHSQSSLQFFDDLNIREYGANAINGACILVDGAGDRYINRLTTDNGSNPTGYAGIRVITCASLVISNSNIIHAGTCLSLEPTAGLTIPSVEAQGTFFDTSVKGIAILPVATGNVLRCKFTHCWFGTHTTAGVEMSGAGTWDGITFSHCDFYGSPIGISVPSGANGWWQADACIFAGHTTAAISVVAGANHYAKISNNHIGPHGGFGANALSIAMAAGTYAGWEIEGNTIFGNTTNPPSELGTATTNRRMFGNNGGLVTAPAAIFNSTVLPLTTFTVAGAGWSMPAGSMRAGTTIRITSFLTNPATASTLTAKLVFGTGNVATDATIVGGLAFGAGTAVAGGAKLVAEFIVTSATTALATITLFNNAAAAGGVATTGLTNLPVQTFSAVASLTISTTAASFLGLWLSNTVASAITCRATSFEVVSQ